MNKRPITITLAILILIPFLMRGLAEESHEKMERSPVVWDMRDDFDGDLDEPLISQAHQDLPANYTQNIGKQTTNANHQESLLIRLFMWIFPQR